MWHFTHNLCHCSKCHDVSPGFPSDFELCASFICDVPPPHLRQCSHPGQWGPWPIHGLWVVNVRRRDSLSEPQCCYKGWLWIPHFHEIISTLALWHQFSLPFHLSLALLTLTWIHTSPAALQGAFCQLPWLLQQEGLAGNHLQTCHLIIARLLSIWQPHKEWETAAGSAQTRT